MRPQSQPPSRGYSGSGVMSRRMDPASGCRLGKIAVRGRESAEPRAHASVQMERDRVKDDRGDDAPDPDFGERRPKPVGTAANGGEGDAGCRPRELRPAVWEFAAPLGVDGRRTADREHEKAA